MPVVYAPDYLQVHIRRLDVESTVCGMRSQFKGMAKPTVITCDECISSWVRTGNPYTEVK